MSLKEARGSSSLVARTVTSPLRPNLATTVRPAPTQKMACQPWDGATADAMTPHKEAPRP